MERLNDKQASEGRSGSPRGILENAGSEYGGTDGTELSREEQRAYAVTMALGGKQFAFHLELSHTHTNIRTYISSHNQLRMYQPL